MPVETPTPTPYNALFISTYTGLGGGETSLYEMVRNLDPARWTPHLLVPKDDQLAERWRSQGWPVHIFTWRPAMPLFVPGVWARLPRVRAFKALLEREGIDVVHLDYHSMPLAGPACEAAGVPWFWLCWGWWLKPRPWQRGLFRRVWHTFTPSQVVKDGFLGDPPFMAPERLEVNHPGVDSTRFHPDIDGSPVREAFGVAPDAPVITILGRFQPLKGHLNFLGMAARIAPDFPEARFLIVGDNVLDGAIGDRHKAAVLQTVQDNPYLKRQVIFTGFRDDTERVLAATDILVSASDFESYGMVHVEAMASGVPVVSTNRGGPRETIIDGETGFLVPPRDPEALAGAVRQLLADPALRQRMGRAGRAHVVNHLDIKHYAARYDAVMTDLIARARQDASGSRPG